MSPSLKCQATLKFSMFLKKRLQRWCAVTLRDLFTTLQGAMASEERGENLKKKTKKYVVQPEHFICYP